MSSENNSVSSAFIDYERIDGDLLKKMYLNLRLTLTRDFPYLGKEDLELLSGLILSLCPRCRNNSKPCRCE